jgi:hypothetical protein
MTSSVAPIFASSAGERNELQRALALTRTRRVRVAQAVIVVHDSRMSPLGSGIASRWSMKWIAWKPRSSQIRADSAMRSQRLSAWRRSAPKRTGRGLVVMARR